MKVVPTLPPKRLEINVVERDWIRIESSDVFKERYDVVPPQALNSIVPPIVVPACQASKLIFPAPASTVKPPGVVIAAAQPTSEPALVLPRTVMFPPPE